jgi:hypothetical protein
MLARLSGKAVRAVPRPKAQLGASKRVMRERAATERLGATRGARDVRADA